MREMCKRQFFFDTRSKDWSSGAAAVVRKAGGAITLEEIKADPQKCQKLGSRCCMRVFSMLISYVAIGYLLVCFPCIPDAIALGTYVATIIHLF
ncbi:hypothetical protein Hdeb2414_s0066g00767291 [Helianthus debilis subsp. tardiflorus]